MIGLRQRLQAKDDAGGARQALEQAGHHAALVVLRYGRRRGLGVAETADRVGMARRTLSAWHDEHRRHARPGRRGRPPRRLGRDVRQDVWAFLALVGPRTSLATLRGAFPRGAPAALERERERFRRAALHGRYCVIKALRWRRPGWVWALDFAKPPRPIEGAYPKILLVRDLASGKQLAALPVAAETTAVVRDLLTVLFERFGCPLVIKGDNGGAFRDATLREGLRRRGIALLSSPPALPEYNGACEAGVGSIKTRTHHEAARHDRPGRWTCNDLEAARRQANETARPWGHRGPTPDERFRERRMPSETERRRFLASYSHHELAEREARGLSEIAELGFWKQASVDRFAIARALTDQGVLSFRQRRISLPFNSHSRARIR